MEEKPLLLKKHDPSQKRCFNTSTKVLLFVILYGSSAQLSIIAEPQYIYAYLKSIQNNTEILSTDNTSDVSRTRCTTNSSSASDELIQGLASDWSWYIAVVQAGFSIPALIFAGPIADKIGRKPILLWNVLLTFISFVFKTVIVYRRMDLVYYVISSGIWGLCGTFYSFHMANGALIADCATTDKDKSFKLTLYDTLLFLGSICYQISAGYFIEYAGFIYPFIVSSGMQLVLFIVILIMLEDPKKSTSKLSGINIREVLRQMGSLWCTDSRQFHNHVKILLVHFAIYCLAFMPYNAFTTLRVIYTLGEPFCWSAVHISWYNAIANFVKVIVGSGMLKFIHVNCSRVKDEYIAMFGLMSSIAYYTMFGLSNTDWMVYISTAAGVFRILPFSLIKSLLSRLTSKDKQGVLFSNIYVLEASCNLGGTVLFNNIYHRTLSIQHGFVLFVMAGFAIGALLLMICIYSFMPRTSKHELQIDEPSIQQNE